MSLTKDVKTEIERSLMPNANGETDSRVDENELSGVQIRVPGQALVFTKGDEFTFPDEYCVLKSQITSGEGANKRTTPVYYTFVTLKNGRVVRFYLGTLTRRRRAVAKNPDGVYENTNQYVAVSGEVPEAYQRSANMRDGMSNLWGKTVVVSSITPVECFEYGSTKPRVEYIPEMNFKEKAAPEKGKK